MKTFVGYCAPPSRVLYVDQNQDSRQVLNWILKNAGYVVDTATSITDGLRLAKREPFDLYILASRFTDGSGVELCRQLRAFDRFTPIIFFSGEAYQDDIAAGLAAGAQAYLTKPMGIYTIIQTVAEFLNGAKNVQVGVQSEVSPIQKNQAHKFPALERQA